ncbi:hypothetical protein EUGRSUZ_D01197 [Eucalyptus grandis]|uniref:Uncharacterized protein n=2 Tax=Eucalyptus grandis TaxID=71139 RepID=A0ACC3L5X5_EUCGR|nr:hypothetical protein EUGRSUZ_D01197 [Eucalyptus grandis]
MAKMASTLILGMLGLVLMHACRVFVWRPRRLRSKLRRQGVEGPPPSHLLLGNIPDIQRIQADVARRARESREMAVSLTPGLRACSRTCKNGPIFIYSSGHIQFLSISDVELVKELNVYLPTKINREIWKLDKQIRSMILEVVKERLQASHEKDLLQVILEGAKNEGLPSSISAEQFIMDNCKNIYFAGYETAAITYPARVRAEVLEIFGCGVLDSNKLQGMKTLTMVIHETLRLYPPAMFSMREALEDIEFKGLLIPQGSNIQIPIHILHRLPEIWGTDAGKFQPERFAQGISGACKSAHAYMPFGSGPRICAGQHFALAELKVILLLILAKFSFSLSPSYHHSPAFRLVVEPGDGVILHVRKV